MISKIFLPALSTKIGAKQVDKTLTIPITIEDRSDDKVDLAAWKIKKYENKIDHPFEYLKNILCIKVNNIHPTKIEKEHQSKRY
jgi:hypothetical protein